MEKLSKRQIRTYIETPAEEISMELSEDMINKLVEVFHHAEYQYQDMAEFLETLSNELL